MPTASDALRNFAKKTFGGYSDTPVVNELERRGFDLTHEFCWRRRRRPDNFEWNCIYFLIEEWDYGGYDED